MSEPSAPSTSKSPPKNYIHVVGLARSTMIVSDACVSPSQAVVQVSSDLARKLPEAIRSWFGISPDLASSPRIYRELMIDYNSKDQLLWQSDEHLTPEYVLLYDLPGEDDDSCKEIANIGHGERTRQTVEHVEEERKVETGQSKGKGNKKNKRRQNRKAKKDIDVRREENSPQDEKISRLQATIVKLEEELNKHREAAIMTRTLTARNTHTFNNINRRRLLDYAREKLSTTYSKIPELVIRDCYDPAEYERQLCSIVSQVLSVLKEEHQFLREAEIKMIVDSRPGTIRKAGNDAAHPRGPPDTSDDSSNLTEPQKLTFASIRRFIDEK